MLEEIARAVEGSKANRDKAVTIHFQVLTNADLLQNVDPKRFCEEIGIEPSWALEFRKMIKLASLTAERGYTITKA